MSQLFSVQDISLFSPYRLRSQEADAEALHGGTLQILADTRVGDRDKQLGTLRERLVTQVDDAVLRGYILRLEACGDNAGTLGERGHNLRDTLVCD